jgi:hypothetical protein
MVYSNSSDDYRTRREADDRAVDERTAADKTRLAASDAAWDRAREAHATGEPLNGRIFVAGLQSDSRTDAQILTALRDDDERFAGATFEPHPGGDAITVSLAEGNAGFERERDGQITNIHGVGGLDAALEFARQRDDDADIDLRTTDGANVSAYVSEIALERGVSVLPAGLEPDDPASDPEAVRDERTAIANDAFQAEEQTFIEVDSRLPETIERGERWDAWRESIKQRWASHYSAERAAGKDLDSHIDKCAFASQLAGDIAREDARTDKAPRASRYLRETLQALRDEGARPTSEREREWDRGLGTMLNAAGTLRDESILRTTIAAERDEMRTGNGLPAETRIEPARPTWDLTPGHGRAHWREFVDLDGHRAFTIDAARQQITDIRDERSFELAAVLAQKSWGGLALNKGERDAEWMVDKCARLGVRVSDSHLQGLYNSKCNEFAREMMGKVIARDDERNVATWTVAQSGIAPTVVERGDSARQNEHRAGLELQHGARSANAREEVAGTVVAREAIDDRTLLVIKGDDGKSKVVALDREDATDVKVGQRIALGRENEHGLRVRDAERERELEATRERERSTDVGIERL